MINNVILGAYDKGRRSQLGAKRPSKNLYRPTPEPPVGLF